MKIITQIPIMVKKHLDYILAVILLFILLTPTDVWDKTYGQLDFYYVVFPIITVLLVLVCVANWIEKKRSFLSWLRGNIWFVVFAVSLLAAVLFSTNRHLSVSYLPYYFSGIFMACVIYAGGLTYRQIRRILAVVTIGLLLTAIYAVMQRIQGVAVNPSFTNLTVNQNMPGRVESVFGNPNIYAFTLTSLLPVVVAYMLIVKSCLWRALGAISFILGVMALMMTYSRGAWFGFAAGLFLFIAIWKPKLVPIFLLFGAIAIPFLPTSIKDRFLTIFNPNDTSISYRGLLLNSSLQLIADRPISGAGLGLVTVQDVVHQSYWPSYLDPVYRFYHSHNIFVQTWCEMGIFGLVSFIGAFFHNMVSALRKFRQKSKSIQVLTASLSAGMVAMLLCGLTDCPLNTLRTMLLFWILFGLLGSVKKVNETDILFGQMADLSDTDK